MRATTTATLAAAGALAGIVVLAPSVRGDDEPEARAKVGPLVTELVDAGNKADEKEWERLRAAAAAAVARAKKHGGRLLEGALAATRPGGPSAADGAKEARIVLADAGELKLDARSADGRIVSRGLIAYERIEGSMIVVDGVSKLQAAKGCVIFCDGDLSVVDAESSVIVCNGILAVKGAKGCVLIARGISVLNDLEESVITATAVGAVVRGASKQSSFLGVKGGFRIEGDAIGFTMKPAPDGPASLFELD